MARTGAPDAPLAARRLPGGSESPGPGRLAGEAPGASLEGSLLGRLRPLPRGWFRRDALEVAPELLNKVLVTADGRAGRIVEVEAYRGSSDPGSHAYRGRTPRNASMFGAGGTLYVYRSYGMHWCANLVCGPEGEAQAVLLRALEPLAGLEAMRRARGWSGSERDLCRGPGRLCQALGIDRSLDGCDVSAKGGWLWLADDGEPPPRQPVVTTRVGLSAGVDLPWRFYLRGHSGVSRPLAAEGL